MTFLNCVLFAFCFVWGVAVSAAFFVIAINDIKSHSLRSDSYSYNERIEYELHRKMLFGMIASMIYLGAMYLVAYERFLCFIARWRRSNRWRCRAATRWARRCSSRGRARPGKMATSACTASRARLWAPTPVARVC